LTVVVGKSRRDLWLFASLVFIAFCFMFQLPETVYCSEDGFLGCLACWIGSRFSAENFEKLNVMDFETGSFASGQLSISSAYL
jgi:hypothetical protein